MHNGPVMSAILLLCRLIVGGLLVFAAVLKLPKPGVFHDSIRAFRVLPDHLAAVSAFAFPWLEIIAGVCLVLGVWARASATICAGLLVGFLGAVISVMVRSDVTVSECGCFGDAIVICTGPPGPCHIVQNVVLSALAIIVIVRGAGRVSIDDLMIPRIKSRPADLIGMR